MIDKKLIEAALTNNALLLSMDDNFSLIAEMQKAVGVGEGVTSDDERLTNFDPFALAWNHQTKDGKWRLLAVAYRRHNDIFPELKMNSPIRWDNFTMAQQAAIKNVCAEQLQAAVSLFANEMAADQWVKGFAGALKEREQDAAVYRLKEKVA